MRSSGRPYDSGNVASPGAEYDRALLTADDPATSLVWLRRAAKHGCRRAQYNLALACLCGTGAPQDPLQAVHWFEAAAVRGLRAAMLHLGVLALQGRGTPQDDSTAFTWLASASGLGEYRAILPVEYLRAKLAGKPAGDLELSPLPAEPITIFCSLERCDGVACLDEQFEPAEVFS
ncbi:MAG: tetratricopeptide repeat protein [Bryobacteraceae bacterium]|nr:tetratricopeptide repeat protein [Bryobacteraceae bacterium]